MKVHALVGAMALLISSGVMAAEVAQPESTKECCCCKKDEHGKMDCCKDKANESEKTGHEGHDMEGMNHK